MKLIVLLSVALLVGCSTMPTLGNTNRNSVAQSAPSGELVTYPSPQSSISKCIRGTIDEVIAGQSATIIWYQGASGNGLTMIRLPMNHPARIKVTTGAFCYDYFKVNP